VFRIARPRHDVVHVIYKQCNTYTVSVDFVNIRVARENFTDEERSLSSVIVVRRDLSQVIKRTDPGAVQQWATGLKVSRAAHVLV
jgi:hypothetical protein